MTPPKGTTSLEKMPLADADHAGVELLGDAPGAAQIPAEQIGGEPERRVVGEPDRIGLGVEAHQRRDGAEDLLAHDLHIGVTSPTDGWAVEERAGRIERTAGEDFRALLDGVADERLDLLDRRLVDQRADRGAGFHAWTDGELVDRLDEGRREAVVDAGLHQDAIGADAGLAGIAVFEAMAPATAWLEIGVVEHDKRRVAAELER